LAQTFTSGDYPSPNDTIFLSGTKDGVSFRRSTQLLSLEDFPVQSQQTSRMWVLIQEERVSFPLWREPWCWAGAAQTTESLVLGKLGRFRLISGPGSLVRTGKESKARMGTRGHP